MAQTLRNTVVNRHENLHYVKFDGVSKPVLAGTGLTDWTQAVDPSTDDDNISMKRLLIQI